MDQTTLTCMTGFPISSYSLCLCDYLLLPTSEVVAYHLLLLRLWLIAFYFWDCGVITVIGLTNNFIFKKIWKWCFWLLTPQFLCLMTFLKNGEVVLIIRYILLPHYTLPLIYRFQTLNLTVFGCWSKVHFDWYKDPDNNILHWELTILIVGGHSKGSFWLKEGSLIFFSELTIFRYWRSGIGFILIDRRILIIFCTVSYL